MSNFERVSSNWHPVWHAKTYFFWKPVQFWTSSNWRIFAMTFCKLIIQWLIHELPARSAWNARTKPRTSTFYIARAITHRAQRARLETSLNCELYKDDIENAATWVCSELNKLSDKIGISMSNLMTIAIYSLKGRHLLSSKTHQRNKIWKNWERESNKGT